jgi:hypothetical protein
MRNKEEDKTETKGGVDTQYIRYCGAESVRW